MNPTGKCYGMSEIFDSVEPEAHAYAKALCDRCPVIEACERNRDEMLQDISMRLQAQGTWAGVLLDSAAEAQKRERRRLKKKASDERLRSAKRRAEKEAAA